MRLIDADALLEKIDTEREILVKDGRLGTEYILVHYVREFIEDAPTVDAVEVGKQAFSGEMKLMPAEDATFANPYKIVLEDLKQVSLFTGKYDAKNGNEHFMFGILTVMEYIADKAENQKYTDMFIDNMNKSKYGVKAE